MNNQYTYYICYGFEPFLVKEDALDVYMYFNNKWITYSHINSKDDICAMTKKVTEEEAFRFILENE